LIDISGKVILSTDPSQEGLNVSGARFYTEGFKKDFISPPFLPSPSQPRLVIVSAFPIVEEGQGVVGVMAGYSDIATLDRIMAEPAGLGQTGQSYLVGEDYTPITSMRFAQAASFQRVHSEGIDLAVQNKIRGRGLYSDYHGNGVVGVYQWLPSLQVALVVEQNQSEAFGPLNIVLLVDLLTSLAAVVLTVVVAYYVTRSVSSPLRILSETATQIAAGDLERSVDIRREDEIGQLARSFNSMTSRLRSLIGELQTDLTDLKRAQAALRESEIRFRAVFENSRDAIGVFNRGIHVFVNPAYLALFGYERGESVTGKPILDFIAPDERERIVEYIRRRAKDEPVPSGYETRGQRRNGEIFDMDVKVSSIEIAGENLTLVIMRDITEGKLAQAALVQARNELEERVRERTLELHSANLALEKAARLKDEFLASMSHELRTPLTGILGLSESLQMSTYGELNLKQLKVLGNIQQSGQHLLELINDILDLSKIEAEKLDLKTETVSLGEICQACLQLTRGMAQQKNMSASFSMAPNPIFLCADARRLKQLLVNLLSNAIKFSANGGKFGLEVIGSREECLVRITVWDKGIGIKAEDFPRLFQAFTQLDSRLARQYSGTGLGLSLVKRLAELHGGSVAVESEFGQGSRFTVLLPWMLDEDQLLVSGPVEAAELPAQSFTNSAPVRTATIVLLADDNEIMRDLLASFLELKGFQVIALDSGNELLEKLETLLPAIVLMDIQMPGMNGLDAIRKIRKHPDARKSTLPVIAVTALAMAGDRESCLEAGADEYLSKPLNLASLPEMIEKLCKAKHIFL
jgi:PAS domain S-box-containing protein